MVIATSCILNICEIYLTLMRYGDSSKLGRILYSARNL